MSPALAHRGRCGAVAGLAGGAAFGAAMLVLGDMLPAIAGIVRSDATAAGLAVHVVVATAIGVLFALVTRTGRAGTGELVFWGVGYGAVWWLLGGLTLLPLLRGEEPDWSAAAVQAAFPSLLGHLSYGAVAGATLAALGGASPSGRVGRGALWRGALAGGGAGLAVQAALGWSGQLAAAGLDGPPGVRWGLSLALGAASGLAYAVLYPRPRGAIGPGLVRGLSFGLLLWLAIAMVLVPAASGDGLPWSLTGARARAASLPALLLGATLLVAGYRFLTGLVGVMLEDDPAGLADEGVGTRTLRGLGRGAVAGLAGGLAFTVVLAQVGGLGRIAALSGSSSPAAGLAIHLGIAVVLGASYGVLFRHEGGELEAALGWGTSYGVLWWLLGNQTLFPVLLGGSPTWTAADLAVGLPSLIGHLAYGAAVGLTLALLERRSNPWWAAATGARAQRAQLRRERLAATAPGLWTMVAVILLTILTLVAYAPLDSGTRSTVGRSAGRLRAQLPDAAHRRRASRPHLESPPASATTSTPSPNSGSHLRRRSNGRSHRLSRSAHGLHGAPAEGQTNGNAGPTTRPSR